MEKLKITSQFHGNRSIFKVTTVTMGLKKKEKNFWMTPVPANVQCQKQTITFKLDPSDYGRSANEVIQINNDGYVTFISPNSLWNGLIGTDRIVKVNDVTIVKKFVSEIMKGETCTIELFRRMGAKALTKKPAALIRKEHCVFYLEIEKARHITTTSIGARLTLLKKRGYVVQIDPNMICSQLLGRGDAIVDIDGEQLPFQHPDHDNLFRERLAKLSTGKKVKFLVERACTAHSQKETMKFIESICSDNESELARDVIDIGREASNLHFLVLRKLATPSIWRKSIQDCQKYPNRTVEEGQPTSTISISTASTEMKIQSDLDDIEDLKKVTKKSHAVTDQPEPEEDDLFDSST